MVGGTWWCLLCSRNTGTHWWAAAVEVRRGAALGGAIGVVAAVVAGRGGAALLSVPDMVARFGSLAIDLGCRLSCLAFWRVRLPAALSLLCLLPCAPLVAGAVVVCRCMELGQCVLASC